MLHNGPTLRALFIDGPLAKTILDVPALSKVLNVKDNTGEFEHTAYYVHHPIYKLPEWNCPDVICSIKEEAPSCYTL